MSHVTAFFLAAWAFVLHYPGPCMFVFGLFVTAILRKRSAEEFAAMSPRKAAAIRFVQGVLPDAPKIIQTVGLFVTGRVPADAPAPSPKPPSVPPLPVLLMLLALALVGCTPSAADASRSAIRGSVLVTADALKLADSTCAKVATVKKDAALAKTCADAYDIARPFLLAAESGVDAYPNDGGVMCSLGSAIEALSHVAEALTAAGSPLPPVVVDALSLAKGLVCK